MTGELARMEVDCGSVPVSKVAEIVARIMQAQESNHMVDIVILIGRKNAAGEMLPIRIQYRDFGY